MLTQQQIEAIILYHLYGESEAAANRFRDAVSEAAKEISAKQGMQRTDLESVLFDGFEVVEIGDAKYRIVPIRR